MRKRAGFEEAYDRLFASARRVAAQILGDDSEAEAVATETLEGARASWRRVRRHGERWVVTAATDACLDRLADHPGPEPDPGPEQPLTRAHVLHGLRDLPRSQAEVIALRYLAGYHDDDLAATLGKPPAYVAEQADAGLAALRVRLPPEAKLPTGEVPVVVAGDEGAGGGEPPGGRDGGPTGRAPSDRPAAG